MNTNLTELIKAYGTLPHKEVQALLNSKSKDNLQSMLMDLLTEYFNDKNSSTLREHLVVTLSGFVPTGTKIGYNGYRQVSSVHGNAKEYCEAKPVNVTSKDGKRKLNGGGNFTDYSWQKFNRHIKEKPTMLVAGFIDGRLIYILSFKFNTREFKKKLREQLKKRFPDGDKTGQYLRSASFTMNAYYSKRATEVKCFIPTKKELKQYENHITGTLYKVLMGNIPK